MSDLADLYDGLQQEISALASALAPEQLQGPVPATPGWTIRDVVAHLTADTTCVLRADFPLEFFGAIGDPDAVSVLNDWTQRQIEERKDRPLQELLDEWSAAADEVLAMMRGDTLWPDGSFPFVDRVLVTDAAVHQQDIFGALGINRNRDSSAIRIGVKTYTAGIGWRLHGAGHPPLRLDVGDRTYTAGEGDPAATVRASSFELFRALSGRRSPEQIKSYEWDGEPEPYLPYFYPYGIRKEALFE